MSGRLAGRVALVTGAARGIGRAIALAFASAGATVIVNDVDVGDHAASVVEAARQTGVDAVAVAADVTDPAQVERLVATAVARCGHVDILVNNAGGGTNVPFGELSIEMWDATLSKNLRSAFLCTRAVLPGMVAQRFGRVINISSQLAIKGGRELSHYCAAKAGLIGFTKSLALEVAGTGVTVNAIAPGRIQTEETGKARVSPDWLRRKLGEIPLGRFGDASEVAPTALLIASSPDGDYYTGQTFHPNGGDVMA